MRWAWLDLITELDRGKRCVAIRNVSLGEDVMHDHFPADRQAGCAALPCMPHTLVIEGMAQCAGVLVGHTHDFREKVILAKISKAVFEPDVLAKPGTTIRHTAIIERMDERGASCSGVVELVHSATGKVQPFATIDLMFSHIDQNNQGLSFPEHNFVFNDQFMMLLDNSGIPRPPGF